MRREISIYVHIPFCEKKCAYCAFNSFCADEETKNKYINLLCNEISCRSADFNSSSNKAVVRTIYIGGGTPSILNEEQISKVINTIYNSFDVYDNAEFTIEANPNSITEEKLKCWKSLRVNRLSVGVQSLNDKSLAKIGRLHTKKDALEKIKLARKFFDNVSADLIVGLENESGKLLISKDTIENLVNGVAKGFENTQSVSSRVAVGNDNGLYITVTLMVLPNTVINELSMNLQTRIKEVVKKVTDLEVKSIDVRIRNITTPETKTEN